MQEETKLPEHQTEEARTAAADEIRDTADPDLAEQPDEFARAQQRAETAHPEELDGAGNNPREDQGGRNIDAGDLDPSHTEEGVKGAQERDPTFGQDDE